MKKVLMSLFVVQMVIVATFACAECVDQAKLVGSWQRFEVKKENFPDENAISAIMGALEAGEQKIEDLQGEDALAPGMLAFSEAGDMQIDMNTVFSPEQTLHLKVTATWKVECDKLIVQFTSVEDVEMGFTARASDEFKKTMEPQMADFAKSLKEQAAEDPEFSKPHEWPLLYFGKTYALTDDETAGQYVVLKKK